MGSFSPSPEAMKQSARWGKMVARAMEIDPDAWNPDFHEPVFMAEKQARQAKSMEQAAREVVTAEEEK